MRSAATVLAVLLASCPVLAQPANEVLGTLTCTAVGGQAERSPSEDVFLSCLFRAEEGGYDETYSGTLKRLGDHQPIDGPVVLIWTVSGEVETLGPGILEQSYLSARSGDAEDRHLQGQKNSSIILRPFAKAGDATEQTVTVLDLNLRRTGA